MALGIGSFLQPWPQGGEVARAGARVELGADDLLPRRAAGGRGARQAEHERAVGQPGECARLQRRGADFLEADRAERSEEHTSELQSLMRISYPVFCLKKKTH